MLPKDKAKFKGKLNANWELWMDEEDEEEERKKKRTCRLAVFESF